MERDRHQAAKQFTVAAGCATTALMVERTFHIGTPQIDQALLAGSVAISAIASYVSALNLIDKFNKKNSVHVWALSEDTVKEYREASMFAVMSAVMLFTNLANAL